MKKNILNNGKEKQRFSIRKYSTGVVSVLLGITLFGMMGASSLNVSYAANNAETVAVESGKENEVKFNYKFVTENELNENEKKLLKNFESTQMKAKKDKTCYFVYKPTAPDKLPYAGSLKQISPLLMLAGVSLIVFSSYALKERKNTSTKTKIITSVFLLGAFAGLSAIQVSAIENVMLEKFNKSVILEKGEKVPTPPEMLDNYKFTGFFVCGDALEKYETAMKSGLVNKEEGKINIEEKVTESTNEMPKEEAKPEKGEVIEEEIIEIEFKKIEKEDSELTIGEVVRDQEGKKGKKRITRKYETINGVKTSKILEEKEEKIEEPQDEIIRIGTKEEESGLEQEL